MNERMKKQKGITLIALIITIVVLLILAVVAINSIQNDELISKAEQAANKYNESVQNEADQLQNYLDYLNEHSGPKTYVAYTVGQEVIVKADVDEDGVEENHAFYVIENSDTTKETVLLLAKGNINTTTFKQESANRIEFSSTNYWADAEGNILDEYEQKEDATGNVSYDLTETGVPDANVKYALRAAYDYGQKIGAEKGTLMTYKEADDLSKTSFSTKLYETDDFWLGSADSDAYYVWRVQTSNSRLYHDDYALSNGVRPVIEISKSKVTKVQ